MAKFAVAQGIVGGLEKLTSRMVDLSVARENMKMKRESHNLDVKIQNLKIQQLELDPESDPDIVAGQKKILESKQKAEQANLDFAKDTIEEKHNATRRDFEEAKKQQEITDIVRQQNLEDFEADKISGFVKDGAVRFSEKKTRKAVLGSEKDEESKDKLETDLRETKRFSDKFKITGAKRERMEARLRRVNSRLGIIKNKAQVKQDVGETFTPDQEKLITDNMAAFNKSREETIAALKQKGHL